MSVPVRFGVLCTAMVPELRILEFYLLSVHGGVVCGLMKRFGRSFANCNASYLYPWYILKYSYILIDFCALNSEFNGILVSHLQQIVWEWWAFTYLRKKCGADRHHPSCKVCPLLAISRQSFSNFNTRYLISNDHFSHAEFNISFQTIIFLVLVVLGVS